MLHTYVLVFIGTLAFIPGGSNPDITSPNAFRVDGKAPAGGVNLRYPLFGKIVKEVMYGRTDVTF